MAKSPRRVVVTGLGALTPLGNSVPAFWQALQNGTSGAGPITRFDTTNFKTKFACELKGFNVEDYMDRKEARKMDPYCHYAIAACDEAIRDAGIDLDTINKDRVGVIWGSGNGGILTFQEEVVGYTEGGKVPRFNPFFIPKMILDMGAGLVSIRYGFRGPNYSTVSACATSTSSIINAFHYIRWGFADVMVTGGSEAAITEASIGGFNACKALSTRNDSPETASRPFDHDRDGFVMGEGAGALILESLEHAQARGANILAEVLGGGMSGDAYHMTAGSPDGGGVALAIRMALEDAEITPAQVDHVNLHATSTPVGDLAELNGMKSVFGDDLAKAVLTSTKSQTGHLLGAAGAVEGIASILAIRDGIIPPTINLENLDPELPSGLDIVFGQARRQQVNIAMSNTFGFGGHNAILVFGRFSNT